MVEKGCIQRSFLIGVTVLLSFPIISQGSDLDDNLDIRDHAYNALLASKECHKSPNQSITCTYTVDDDLVFSVEGIGEVDAAVTPFSYVASDSRHYARFASRPGCVLIQRKSKKASTFIEAMKDLAYVSLRNGKVYRTWQECSEGQ